MKFIEAEKYREIPSFPRQIYENGSILYLLKFCFHMKRKKLYLLVIKKKRGDFLFPVFFFHCLKRYKKKANKIIK